MSPTEIWVSLACLVLGYFVVGTFISNKPKDEKLDLPRRSPAPKADDDAVTLSNWFRILGVGESASREQVITAYKKMISQYHPDKVSGMGQEIRDVAERQSKQINAAYELGMRLYR